MKYLLDTHIALWALSNSNILKKEIRNILIDPNNQIYYSTASIWEIEIKHLKKPNSIKISGMQLAKLLNDSNAINLTIKNEHIDEIHNVIPIKNVDHNDPFDKLLLAQAMHEKMILITADKIFNNYSKNNLMVI